MGDNLDGMPDAPVHNANVSAFWVDRFEVTKQLWDGVYQWGTQHGYSFANPGLGVASDHPVQTVTWYDVVKWSNARSEMEGLTPAYFTDDAQTQVYRSGNVNIGNARIS